MILNCYDFVRRVKTNNLQKHILQEFKLLTIVNNRFVNFYLKIRGFNPSP